MDATTAEIVSGASSPGELGKRLFVRTISATSSPDINIGKVHTSSKLSQNNINEEIESSDENEDEDEIQHRRRRSSVRRSVAGAKIASQVPSRNIVDSRFVINPTCAMQSFDLFTCKVDSSKDIYLLYRNELGEFRCMFRIAKLPKSLLGAATWQIYIGNSEPIAVLKQVARTLNPTFYLFKGTDAEKGTVVYSFLKKLRGTKIRIFNGEGCKEAALLTHFCLIGDDRVCVKLKDTKSLGEALGETIVDWRLQTCIMRIGRGFDVCLAAACFCLAEFFEAHSLDTEGETTLEVTEALKFENLSPVDWRDLLGW
jgi:hypothetical protein